MGTRNLTIVVADGRNQIAQYGQWDGYPNGQGKTILEFLHTHDLAVFREQLKRVRFVTAEEVQEAYKRAGADDSGFVTMEVVARFDKQYPALGRDHGGGVLEMVYHGAGEVALRDESAFAADGLFCEWAYVVDFDKGTFEVYDGFHKTPVPNGQRFAALVGTPHTTGEFYPVQLVACWDLTNLPTLQEFFDRIAEARPQEDAA